MLRSFGVFVLFCFVLDHLGFFVVVVVVVVLDHLVLNISSFLIYLFKAAISFLSIALADSHKYNSIIRDFPGGPVVETLRFQCRG